MDTWGLFIKSDLKTRIGTAENLPAKLTLQYLAAHYGVSLTPVRQAIAELIEESYIHKTDNGRLEINAKRLGAWVNADGVVKPQPPRDYFNEIHEDVVFLCLQGEPVFLREEEMADKYGLSTTAIRRIFSRMAGLRIVEHIPRRGWRVRPFRQKLLEDFTRVRKILELEAMVLAWPKLVDEDLQAMLDGNAFPQNDDETPLIDNSIHEYFIEKADNEYIHDFLERHMRFFAVMFGKEGLDRQAAIETIHQHRRLLNALLKRDRDEAKNALLGHLDYDHSYLKKISRKGLETANERFEKAEV